MNKLVSNIVSNRNTQDLLHGHGLVAQHISWEDTARSKNSCWGPNITDMTLRVEKENMPVIRRPNFSDMTRDVPIGNFKLNIDGKVLTLDEYLKNFGKYSKTSTDSLFCERDSVVLTSTQCCVLPVEKGKNTDFCVRMFNYQSSKDQSAVLVITVSKNGTSVQTLSGETENLYFNKDGEAHFYRVERLEDSRERRGEQKTRVDSFKEMKDEEKLENTLLVIQVPLKVERKELPPGMFGVYKNAIALGSPCGSFSGENAFCIGVQNDQGYGEEEGWFFANGPQWCSTTPPKMRSTGAPARGMDMGQLSIGKHAGTFPKLPDKLIRDDRFPVRVVVQYYRATDGHNISEKNITDIAEQLNSVDSKAIDSGSLVLNQDTGRKTEPDLPEKVNIINPNPEWGTNGIVSF